MTKRKDKILPIKIWLDEESCWDNKPQGDGYTEYVREDYHAQALLHVLNKGVEQGKKEMLEKAIKWLGDNIWLGMDENDEWDWTVFFESEEEMVESFKKAMEE